MKNFYTIILVAIMALCVLSACGETYDTSNGDAPYFEEYMFFDTITSIKNGGMYFNDPEAFGWYGFVELFPSNQYALSISNGDGSYGYNYEFHGDIQYDYSTGEYLLFDEDGDLLNIKMDTNGTGSIVIYNREIEFNFE